MLSSDLINDARADFKRKAKINDLICEVIVEEYFDTDDDLEKELSRQTYYLLLNKYRILYLKYNALSMKYQLIYFKQHLRNINNEQVLKYNWIVGCRKSWLKKVDVSKKQSELD